LFGLILEIRVHLTDRGAVSGVGFGRAWSRLLELGMEIREFFIKSINFGRGGRIGGGEGCGRIGFGTS
jgi:hypothetical protein